MLVLSLAACGSANKPASSTTRPETSAPTEQPESSSTAPAESEPETQPETGKTLVVYYSASGNTERVAKDIAEAAGADLFEIVPTEVYTSEDLNWTNPDSRVSREHDDESLRDVPLTTTEVPDWDSYDTVFIGYPIWWGIAAWPVDTFVKNNDFTGKTVIPFATSSSSGMGQSGSLLADMAGTGEWQEGQRFSSGVSSDDVQSWVNGLGL
ncbi:flavodoxin [Agathobaculum butyriciproducens]|uniref:flavodoxin n=1 Tax=Agathobaculum butyriciproducens TaxID=1628085 RepID=UPI003AB2F12B